MKSPKSLCPHCRAVVETVDAEKVTINVSGYDTEAGAVYSCPSCHVILSVQADPFSVRAPILRHLEQLVDAAKKTKP